jgi:hypothetical protein
MSSSYAENEARGLTDNEADLSLLESSSDSKSRRPLSFDEQLVLLDEVIRSFFAKI